MGRGGCEGRWEEEDVRGEEDVREWRGKVGGGGGMSRKVRASAQYSQ